MWFGGQPAAPVRNRIHGSNPAPGAYTYRGNQTVKLWRAAVVEETRACAAPGTVVVAGNELVISAGTGLVRLLEVQPESRARMTGPEFARGYHVLAGEQWTALPGRRAGG